MDDERAAALVAALADDNRELTPAAARPDLTPNQLAAMARDIATNVREIEDILEAYKITQAQYAAHIHQNGYFQQLLQSYAKEWESIKSTNKRLAFQAAAALEEKLPSLAYRMGSANEDLADVTSVAKLFTQLAGAGPQPGISSSEQGERFSIQINIGRNTVEIAGRETKQTSNISEGAGDEMAVQQLNSGTGGALEIQQLSEGPGKLLEVQQLREGKGNTLAIQELPQRARDKTEI